MRRFLTVPYIRATLIDNPYNLKNFSQKDYYTIDIPFSVTLIKNLQKSEYALTRDYYKYRKCMEGYLNPYEFKTQIQDFLRHSTTNNQTLTLGNTFEVIYRYPTLLLENKEKSLGLHVRRRQHSNNGEYEIRPYLKYHKKHDNISYVYRPIEETFSFEELSLN